MSVLRDSATMLRPRNPPQRRRPCLKAGSKSLNFLSIFISTLSHARVDVNVFDVDLAPYDADPALCDADPPSYDADPASHDANPASYNSGQNLL